MKRWTWGLFNRHSMVFRLSVSILGSVFVGIVILMFFVSRNTTNILERSLMEGARQAVSASVNNIFGTTMQVEHALHSVQANLDKLDKNDTLDIKNVLLSEIELLNINRADFANAWVYVFPQQSEDRGTLFYSVSRGDHLFIDQIKVADVYEKYPWLRQVEHEKGVYWSEPYFWTGLDGKRTIVSSVVPFRFEGEQKYSGIVVFSLNLAEIQQEVSSFRFFGMGRLLLLSHRGLYIVHPNADIQLKKTIFDLAKEYNLPELRHTGEQLSVGRKGIIKMSSSSVFGDAVIFFYATIPSIKWGVCLVFSQTQFFEPVHRFHMALLGASVLGLLGIFLLISWICHRSADPLLKLSRIAFQYGNGDFSGELPKVNTDDELSILINAFDKMQHNLLNHIESEKKNVAEQQKTASELEIARRIQQSELPVDFPHSPHFAVRAIMNAARSVGGDFYDFFFIDKNHFAIVIADVAGKGVPAALYMMTVKSLLKDMMCNKEKLETAIKTVNNELCSRNNTNMFVTLFAAVVDLQTGLMNYINAGHNPPLLMLDGSEFKYMPFTKNIAVGIMENYSFKAGSVHLKQGSRLFLYTDGVTEAQNQNGEFFGEERLQKVLNNDVLCAASTLKFVREGVENFVLDAEQSDDMTMLEFMYFGKRQALVVQAKPDKNDEVLTYVESALRAGNVAEAKIMKALLAVGEIFANVASYAYEETGYLRVEIYTKKQMVYIQFIDAGYAYDPLQRDMPDVSKDIDARQIGGLGIFITRKVVDFIDYERHCGLNVLTIGIEKNEQTV